MKGILKTIDKRLGQIRRGLTVENFGLIVPPFTASFKVKRRQNKMTITTKVVQTGPTHSLSSPLDVLWDTVDTMTDTERRRAMKRRDWGTAIAASLVQGYIRFLRQNKKTGVP